MRTTSIPAISSFQSEGWRGSAVSNEPGADVSLLFIKHPLAGLLE